MFPTRVPIIMPQLGESIAEATIVSISIKPGDHVTADQEIIEVETNKALLQVTTPCAGEIVELTAAEKETYLVGATLGFIQAVPEEIDRLGLKPTEVGGNDPMPEVEPGQPSPAAVDETPVPVPRLAPTRSTSTGKGGLPVPAAMAGAGYYSPRLRARLGEIGLQAADLAGLSGTGANGRVTVGDLEKFLGDLDARQTEPAPAMRVAVGDAMRRSWARPLATVGRPVRLDALLAHRKLQPDPKPGMALYVIRAFALALAEDRTAATRLIGKRLVPATSIDIGFAVEVDGGLMVPVLRDADTSSLAGLNSRYHELITAARRRQVPAEALGNAAGTVTNFGPFGLTWATPLPLPDETLMLGLGAGQRVPSWDEEKGAFLPVTEAEVTLSFDHRSLDGGGAGRLLARVAELLIHPGKL